MELTNTNAGGDRAATQTNTETGSATTDHGRTPRGNPTATRRAGAVGTEAMTKGTNMDDDALAEELRPSLMSETQRAIDAVMRKHRAEHGRDEVRAEQIGDRLNG